MRKILFFIARLRIPFLKAYAAFAALMIGITLSFTLYLPNAIAEDSMQHSLPEDAKVRIGKGWIMGMAYSPDGMKLAVASTTGVWLYNAETGEELNLLVLGPDGAWAVAFSPDGTTLAAAGTIGSESGDYRRGVIQLWDSETGSLLQTIPAVENRSGFDHIAFSPDGTTLAAVGTIGSDRNIIVGVVIQLWDSETGSLLRTMPTVESRSGSYQIAFSPDGTILAIPGATYSESGDRKWVVQLWDSETGSLLRTLTKDDIQSFNEIAFSPDGTTLATAGAIGSEWRDRRGAIQLWDIETGSLWRTMPAVGDHSGFDHIAFSPDGNIIASASGNAAVQLWDAETGEPVWLPSSISYTNWWNDPTGFAYDVTFSPDGGTLAIMGWNRAIRLWDMDTSSLETIPAGVGFVRVLSDADPNPRTLIEHRNAYGDKIAYSPDGTLLAVAGGFNNKTIVLRNAGTGNYLQTLTARSDIKDIAFSPDSTMIAAGSREDGAIYLWDLLTNEPQVFERAHEHFIQSVAFSPDGTLIASGAYVDSTVRLWDVKTGTLLHTLRGHQSHLYGVLEVAFSLDGSTLASVGGDGTIRLWDAKTGTLLHTLRTDRVHLREVQGIAFSPDGSTLASRGPGSTIRLWDVKTGNNFKTFDYNTLPIDIAFSPDGGTLVSAHHGSSSLLGTILLWDVEMGGIFKTFKYGVSDIAFSPDGSTVASIRGDSVIMIWDALPTPTTDADESHQLSEDVNADGVVNIQDLVAVAMALGQTEENRADVNADGVVNIQDLVAVAVVFGDAAAAPGALGLNTENLPTRTEVEQWLHQALQANLTDPVSLKGIRFLEQLLTAFTPKETALLANYPNPFNPETWIPYQLAEAADVTLSIYEIDGKLVRTLDLGHQPVGLYHHRSRAAYWDGRNAVGEPVASGVYFYTLTAGDFTATRKMLIAK